MNRLPVLETERLILRTFSESDVEAIFTILSNEEVNEFLPMFPLKTLQEAKRYLHDRYLDSQKMSEEYHYAICFKEDRVPIGYIDVNGGESHDLGYGLRKEFWNQGIVTEAGRSVIEQLKKDGVSFITATHDVNNPGSGAVMKKLGMTYRYSYEEYWQPKGFLVTFRMYQLNLDGQTDRVYQGYWNRYPVHFVEKNV